MINKLKRDLRLLLESGKHIVLFELIYKMVAVSVVYPLVILLIDIGMRAAGIRYLTNEYIIRVITNPVVIAIILLAIVLFVAYCTYEMAFLAVCFETKRRNLNASIIDSMYGALQNSKKMLNIRGVILYLFYFLFIIGANVTICLNILLSGTTISLIRKYIFNNKWYVKGAVFLVIALIYFVVIIGIYTFNVFTLEGRGFNESYKKSFQIVKKHPVGTITTLIFYNLVIALFIGIVYFVISIVLIAGVKILDMAYIGSAMYLSVLSTVRTIMRLFLIIIAIPMSYSTISHLYYKYTKEEDITYEFIDIDEGSAKRNKIVYGTVLGVSVVINIIYIVFSFNTNPFSKVAIFHETQITAHRGASTSAPENTLAAFKQAMEDMADYIELDIQMSKDGELVVMHDNSTYRTTGVEGSISDMTLEEIKSLDAGSWYGKAFAGEKIPTLKEVLELTNGKINLNIEIKSAYNSEAIAEKLVSMLEEYKMIDDCVITSFDYKAIKKAKQCNEDIQVGYILSVAYGDFYEMDDVDFFSINASFLTKRTVDAIHKSGKMVFAWTVNNETSIKNLTNKGVDNIITDEPVLAREVIYSRDTSETLINMIKYVFNG